MTHDPLITGWGHTPFGKLDAVDLEQLIRDAALPALDSAGLAPEEIDGLFVGPSDLSITLSRGAKVDKLGKDTLDAMRRVSDAAKRNGLVAGAFGGSAEVIRTYQSLGFTFLAAAVDVDLLQWGSAALLKSLEV